jgi:UDP-N-acetylmuramoyl-tripeptide--D-alanyl-D-alanine ligase
MIRGWLSDFAAAVNGRLIGEDVSFSGLSTDTRTLADGELFVALRGERFDAHRFLDQAVARGAAALVVQDPAPAITLPQLLVGDTLAALGGIAQHWRMTLHPTVIGITGSNGKTTVKNLLAAMLGQRHAVLATHGNLNNDIGVPLTLAQLAQLHRYAVVEMGCSRPGDIARLAQLARPSVAIVTNAAAAHLEGLGSVEGVAREKGALFAALDANGAAVLNADDPHADGWRRVIGSRRTLSFGAGAEADVRVSDYRSLDTQERQRGAVAAFRLSGAIGELAITSPLPGLHNALNVAAAAAAATLVGATAGDIEGGIATAEAAAGRLAVRQPIEGVVLIDDSYNANPASLRAAVAYLTSLPGRSWLVLGDMAELGGDPWQAHAQCGAEAVRAGVERVFSLGKFSAAAAAEAKRTGAVASTYDDHQALIEDVAGALTPGVNVLVKGSRSAAMERVANGLAERLARGDRCFSC